MTDARPLQDIVVQALARGVVFDRGTQAFLRDLCKRYDARGAFDFPASGARIAEELHALGDVLNDLTEGGDDSALAAQVWRIEVIAAHEQHLTAISHQAAARATIMRRHGLHFFEDADLVALAAALRQARDIGESGNEISRAAWRALTRGVSACFWITREERVFMLDQMATYLLEEPSVVLARDVRAIIQAIANGETEAVAA